MKKFRFKLKLPSSFKKPDMLPPSKESANDWQEANKAWWEETPMKYDWYKELDYEEGSIEYFNEIDRRLQNVHSFFADSKSKPYDSLIPYEFIKNSNVLEIGVGNGTHAELLARHCKKYTGIDLTSFATDITVKRFNLKGIKGTILNMDAEKLDFPDESFDFVWSWGVIHHSSNPSTIIDEVNRVLKPGGRSILMVYHKSLWHYYIVNGLIRGLFLGEIFKYGSISNIMQIHTDGAIARYYTKRGFKSMISKRLKILRFRVFGHKLEILPLPYSRFKLFVSRLIPNWIARTFLCLLESGMLLVIDLEKPHKNIN